MILEMHVDTVKLYEGEDPYYEGWLSTVVDRVYETRKKQDRAAKRKQPK